jgi:hypothetical protein
MRKDNDEKSTNGKVTDSSLGALISIAVTILVFMFAYYPIISWIIGIGVLLFALYLIIFTKRKYIGIGIFIFPMVAILVIGGCFVLVTRH